MVRLYFSNILDLIHLLGRFLRGILRDLAHWFKDEAAFASDSKKSSVLLPGMTKKAPKSHPPTEDDMFSWDEYKKWLKKVHMKIGSVSVLLTLIL
jgi:THO complex subunit 2